MVAFAIVNDKKIVGYSNEKMEGTQDINVKDLEHFKKYFNFYNLKGEYKESEILEYDREHNY